MNVIPIKKHDITDHLSAGDELREAVQRTTEMVDNFTDGCPECALDLLERVKTVFNMNIGEWEQLPDDDETTH